MLTQGLLEPSLLDAQLTYAKRWPKPIARF
jgi:hypothetical protein